jgi:hypothetical protein
MYPSKLHTRQYGGAELPRPEPTKATGNHTIRAIATTVTVGLAAWCGAGIAHADNNHEQEACALMDDHATAIHLGYSSTPRSTRSRCFPQGWRRWMRRTSCWPPPVTTAPTTRPTGQRTGNRSKTR